MRRAQTLHLLLSLHDVAPFHSKRIRRAEAFFREVGVEKITYLLVPNFHGGGPSHLMPEFRLWAAAERSFAVRWFLHGFYHMETGDDPLPFYRHPVQWFVRRVLTDAEGEFLPLDERAIRDRLDRGQKVMLKSLGSVADGFVAPAWLFNRRLPPLLAEYGFRMTENHTRIIEVQSGRVWPSPVITWSTSRRPWKYASLLGCPLFALLSSRQPLLRIAMHPYDFDHPDVVAEMGFLLRRLMASRRQSFYEEALGLKPNLRVIKTS